jgi:protein-tyrosine phosphatase
MKRAAYLAGIVALAFLVALTCGCGTGTAVKTKTTAHWLNLEQITNARDIGGWKLKDGAAISYGRVYRSGRISQASAQDAEALRKLGLRTTIDLRSEAEECLTGADALTVGGFTRAVRAPMKGVASTEGYADIVDHQKPEVAKVFRTLAEGSAYPLLVHCNAGKDRTGVVTALLMELLGVPRQDIRKEYLLSREAGQEVDGRWIDAVFRAVDAAGGIEKYLDGIGIDATMQSAIRTSVLSPSPRAPSSG